MTPKQERILERIADSLEKLEPPLVTVEGNPPCELLSFPERLAPQREKEDSRTAQVSLARAVYAALDGQHSYVGGDTDLGSVVLDGDFDLYALADAIKLTLEAQGWTAPKEKGE